MECTWPIRQQPNSISSSVSYSDCIKKDAISSASEIMSDFLTYCLVYVLAVVLIFWLIIGGASFWFFCLCRRYYNPNLSPFHPQHPRNLLTHTGTSRSFESSTLHVWIRFCQHVKSINKTSKKLWWQQRFLAFYSNFGHIYGNLRTILKCLKYQKRKTSMLE